jgi:hypothetical protein
MKLIYILILILCIFIRTTLPVIILLLILFLLLTNYSHFNNTKTVDVFDKNLFLISIKNKDILLCGNSPKFPESFSKVTITPNTFIIRFNSVLDNIVTSKTDVLFVSLHLLRTFSVDQFTTWRNKCNQCKIFYIGDLIQNNEVLEEIFKSQTKSIDFTSGFICLSYLCNYINYVNSISLVGFDLPDDYNTPVNWFRKDTMYTGHDIKSEKELLSGLIDKYNINKI